MARAGTVPELPYKGSVADEDVLLAFRQAAEELAHLDPVRRATGRLRPVLVVRIGLLVSALQRFHDLISLKSLPVA